MLQACAQGEAACETAVLAAAGVEYHVCSLSWVLRGFHSHVLSAHPAADGDSKLHLDSYPLPGGATSLKISGVTVEFMTGAALLEQPMAETLHQLVEVRGSTLAFSST